jgi:hypothetical protein
MFPYTKGDTLFIPFGSDDKYHWWRGGQSITQTLEELGRGDLVAYMLPKDSGLQLDTLVNDVSIPGCGPEDLPW